MQCPRCGTTVPDTMSRCGRCDSPLQPTPAAHQPVAAPGHDGPPPIQHQPLGAPLYDSGPPVQAFVESAEDFWQPITPQSSGPSAPASFEAVGRHVPQAPAETPGESTRQWSAAEAFGGPPEPSSTPSAPPLPGSPDRGNGLPPSIDPARVVPGHDLVIPASAQPELTPGYSADSSERTVPQSPYSSSSMGQPPPPPPPAGPEQNGSESVAERTMAVWLSDSPGAPDAPGSPGSTPVYGTMGPPPPNGHGRNETAVLPGMPPGQQPGPHHPGGWQSETWQTAGWQQPPGGPGGPGGPPQRPSGNAGKPLIITVVGLVVVALVAAGVVLWPDGDGDKITASATAGPSAAAANSPQTSKANPAGRQETVTVNKVLNASAASRGGLARAIAASGTCKGLPTAIAGFQKVATQRKAQVAHARALKVRHLANGARLRQTLTRSIQYSLAVDQALLTWAQGRQGCKGKPKPDANYQRARGPLSAQASAAKRQFAALWAPVARQHRLPPRTANGF